MLQQPVPCRLQQCSVPQFTYLQSRCGGPDWAGCSCEDREEITAEPLPQHAMQKCVVWREVIRGLLLTGGGSHDWKCNVLLSGLCWEQHEKKREVLGVFHGMERECRYRMLWRAFWTEFAVFLSKGERCSCPKLLSFPREAWRNIFCLKQWKAEGLLSSDMVVSMLPYFPIGVGREQVLSAGFQSQHRVIKAGKDF